MNADDLGRSSTINKGIIEAHQKGIVTSASLMTDREGFEEAVQLARRNPQLGIGLHLDLDAFFEVEHGAGRLLRYKDPSLPLEAIAAATEAQLGKILETGLTIGHVDGHHHSHLRPELFATIAALVAKYKIRYIRYFKGFYAGMYPGLSMDWILDLVQRFELHTIETFFAGWEKVDSSLPGYKYFDPAVSFRSAELMVHPGRGETWREKELAHCISSKTRASLEQNNIELVNFTQLS